jgi:TonB family protein
MRWFLGVLLLVISLDIRAGEVFLIPEKNPKPVYPVALYRAGIIGTVRVSLTAHADGSVSKIAVPDDAHPELGEAALNAVSQWRFKPWEINSEQPEQITVIAPVRFQLDSKLPIHFNKELRRLKCVEIAWAALSASDTSWVDMAVFSRTRSYLTHSLSPTQLPDEKRLALITELNQSIPSIVRRCRTSPSARIVRFFPQQIRELL